MILNFEVKERTIEVMEDRMNLYGNIVELERNDDLNCVNVWLETKPGLACATFDTDEFEDFVRMEKVAAEIYSKEDIEADMKATFDYFKVEESSTDKEEIKLAEFEEDMDLMISNFLIEIEEDLKEPNSYDVALLNIDCMNREIGKKMNRFVKSKIVGSDVQSKRFQFVLTQRWNLAEALVLIRRRYAEEKVISLSMFVSKSKKAISEANSIIEAELSNETEKVNE